MYYKLTSDYSKATDSFKKDSIDAVFKQHLVRQDTSAFCINLIQKFWKQNSGKYGLDYYTDFKK